MAFREVPTKVDFPAQERAILQFWKDSQAFAKLQQLHKDKPAWSFIDGPITANNPMGVHHGWGRTYKDAMLRFKTMLGHAMRYQNGFDCQGLWVEVEVEKEFGFKRKKEIEEFGLDQFVRMCKARVLRYAAIQTEQSLRLGYWMDWNDPDQLRWLADLLITEPQRVITLQGPQGPVTGTVELLVGQLGLAELGGSYFTFSNENNYMIWTFLKKCWEKGWLYRGADVMPWCPRCATAISQHEIVTDGYAELTHRSITLRFPLCTEGGERRMDAQTGLPEYLLVWTTTPWTLTSNVAAAVGFDLTYLKVLQDNQVLYLAKGTVQMLKGEYQVLGELKGAEMLGWRYDGPYDDLPAAKRPGGYTLLNELIQGVTQTARQAHQVIRWDAVGETEGTGIVHIAPGCGAEDFQLGRQYGLPMIAPLEEEGVFVDGFDWLSGKNVAEVAELIIDDLQRKGLLYRVAWYTHRYPTCWRCKSELVFRLVDEWFISMGEVYDKPRQELTTEEKERSLRYQIMDVVEQIRWIPEFGLAREMDWLRNMHDWMISKKRYWGLALPIWVCADCAHFEVVGDEIELQARAVQGWEVFAGHTPHRPYIDAIKMACPRCQGLMSRIPDVGNPWLDAGIVSFSTLQYRSNRSYWEKWYPANWISESFPGQFRNWFYSLLAMATVIDRSPPFLQNFGYATLVAEDGRPMHKSWGNSIEFNEAADRMGVDVMRWLYCNHKPENDLQFGYTRGDETRRQFLIPLWNAYSFLVTYANLDGWLPEVGRDFDPQYPEGETPRSENLLDQWVLARLNQVVQRVTTEMDDSNYYASASAVAVFIDDLTNWYVRRSRRRFWKSEHDSDKGSAYATLYHVLVKLVRLLAPFTPFFTESIYQNLVRTVFPHALESIHHTRWPKYDSAAVDAALLNEMALSRQIASLGLGARNSANIKVRQPLAAAMAHAGSNQNLRAELVEIVTDELNVKTFEFVDEPRRLVSYRVLPDNKTLGPKFGAQFPKVRVALASSDPSMIAESILAGQPVVLEIDGQRVELSPEEILVQTEPVAGLAVASERGITVALDTNLTQELRAEGLAREVVRRIQAMRKEAGFNIDDRIHTYYQSDDEGGMLSGVMQQWSAFICAETLSVSLADEALPQDAYREEHHIEGQPIRLAVRKIRS